MKPDIDISYIVSLLDSPVRVRTVRALMPGQAFTLKELATEVDIEPSRMLDHLQLFMDAVLIVTDNQGRHEYYRLISDQIVSALKKLPALSGECGPKRVRFGPKQPALRKARVCYNHIAGELGVRLYKSMAMRGFFEANGDELSLSTTGQAFAEVIGIKLADLPVKKRPLCRSCLDWSERRYHLAGSLGIALLDTFIANGWVERESKSRVLTLTRLGREMVERHFPVGIS